MEFLCTLQKCQLEDMWTLRVFLYAIHILGYKWSVTTGGMYCLLAVEDSLKYAGFKVILCL